MEQLMLLIVIPDADIRPRGDGAFVRLHQPVDNLKDRRLSGSVIPD